MHGWIGGLRRAHLQNRRNNASDYSDSHDKNSVKYLRRYIFSLTNPPLVCGGFAPSGAGRVAAPLLVSVARGDALDVGMV